MEQIKQELITLTTGGGTTSLTLTPFDIGKQYVIAGSGTLSGSIVINSATTPPAGTRYKLFYGATFVLNANSITIFGKVLTQQEAATQSIIDILYDGSAYIVNVLPDLSGIPFGVAGVNSRALGTGSTITLKSTIDKKIQRFTGTSTLLSGFSIVLDTATATEGNEFWLDFDSLTTIGANTFTVNGNSITAAQALAGGFSIYNYYSGTTWYSQVVLPPSSSTSGIYSQGFKVFVDAIYGNDSTGTAQRADLPFLTIAAARTAIVALTPTATSRGSIYASGYFAEGYVAANFVDLYNNGGLILERTSGASLATIDDNNVTCDFRVYGYPKLIRSGTGTTPVGNLKIQNASSKCVAWINPNDCTTTGASDINIGLVNGTLTIYSDDLNNSGALTNTDAVTIGQTAGTLTVHAKNLTCVSNVIALTGGTSYLYFNNITGTGTGADSPILVKTTANAYIEFNNLTSATADGAIRMDTGGVANILCKGIVTAPIGYVVETLSTFTGSLIFKGSGVATTTEAANILGTGAVRLEGRLKATGANKNCIIVGDAGPAVLTIKGLEMITNGTGKCLYAAGAVNVYSNGYNVGTVAKDANVTVLGTAVVISTNYL